MDGLALQLLFRLPEDGFIQSEYREGDGRCGICLSTFAAVEGITMRLFRHGNYNHLFHERCIREWLRRRPICPIDRHVITYMQTENGQIQVVPQRRQRIVGFEEMHETHLGFVRSLILISSLFYASVFF